VRLVGAVAFGGLALPITCATLLLVQNANADFACENEFPVRGPASDRSAVRGIGFENAYLSLGGRCTYEMQDGSTAVARQPGWWLSATLITVSALSAALAGHLARREGHFGLLFAFLTIVNVPLGLLLAMLARRREGA
jgi:hypothetical protein